MVGIAVAQDAGVDTRPFWEGAFGYTRGGDEDLVDPIRRGPHLRFHELRDPRRGEVARTSTCRSRRSGGEARAGGPRRGRPHRGSDEDRTWTLASPDNHGVDIAGWADLKA